MLDQFENESQLSIFVYWKGKKIQKTIFIFSINNVSNIFNIQLFLCNCLVDLSWSHKPDCLLSMYSSQELPT